MKSEITGVLPPLFERSGAFGSAQVWNCAGQLAAAFLVFLLLRMLLRRWAGRLKANRRAAFRRFVNPLTDAGLLAFLALAGKRLPLAPPWSVAAAAVIDAGLLAAFLGLSFGVIDLISDRLQYRFSRRNPEFLHHHRLLLELLRRLLKTLLWVGGVIFLLQKILAWQVTPILTGAGVMGVAVAFAAQNTIANLFGTASVLGGKLFKIGDWIRTDSAEGIVEAINLRSVRLRAFSGELVDLPNRVVADAKLENFSDRPYWRLELSFGLVYQTPPKEIEKAIELLERAVSALPSGAVMPTKPAFALTECGESALKLRGYLWLAPTDFYTLQQYRGAYLLQVLRDFAASGIELAYPTRTVWLKADNS